MTVIGIVTVTVIKMIVTIRIKTEIEKVGQEDGELITTGFILL